MNAELGSKHPFDELEQSQFEEGTQEEARLEPSPRRNSRERQVMPSIIYSSHFSVLLPKGVPKGSFSASGRSSLPGPGAMVSLT
jgi:hypothetical protein